MYGFEEQSMRNGKVAARPSRLRDGVECTDGAGEVVGKLMTRLNGLPGAQAPFGPFGQAQSSLVKLGQSENRGLTVKP
jgi:hypothetical protein